MYAHPRIAFQSRRSRPLVTWRFGGSTPPNTAIAAAARHRTGGHFFGAEFDASAGTNKLPADAVRYYIDTLAAGPDHLRGSFGFYRAIPTTTAQNQQRKTRRLTLPVLAVGGAESSGEGPGNTMKLAADDVQTLVLPGCGHWVAEQAPEQLLAAVTAFLAPYRDKSGANP